MAHDKLLAGRSRCKIDYVLHSILCPNLKEHLPGVLDKLLDLDEELNGLPSVEKPVVVRERDGHDRADDNLALDNDSSVSDVVHA